MVNAYFFDCLIYVGVFIFILNSFLVLIQVTLSSAWNLHIIKWTNFQSNLCQ